MSDVLIMITFNSFDSIELLYKGSTIFRDGIVDELPC